MPTGRDRRAAHHESKDVADSSKPSSIKPSGRQREPPPALFLHPSPGTSHVSLPEILAPGAPVLGSSSGENGSPNTERKASYRLGGYSTRPDPEQPKHKSGGAESIRATDRTDALWAEMQATLEEVELSASGGTHVFGPGHDRKLADLRAAQIALAQAWARSEADDAIETALRNSTAPAPGDEVRNLKGTWTEAARPGVGEGTDAPKSTTGPTIKRPDSSGVGVADRLGATLEEETELDIVLARKRREANDQYFQQVNNGVIDVVAKLEDVAVAMRAVEQESQDVWNEHTTTRDHGHA
ncbi:hypothetical protein HIM_08593 [Hirsutella minnesotensis 3608]|uniref:Uncharacterized protein n=1 Tax=Hirsutella minnesotensis 3608 TaxID=1043627 RepID=A0A0F7ZY85_9HYPO|nr:hypothetical protein HIM_08593 [Hirsutella minnesotensis 3608]